MNNTSANEDKAASELEEYASTVVNALKKLDSIIADRDATILKLEEEIDSLKNKLEELE